MDFDSHGNKRTHHIEQDRHLAVLARQYDKFCVNALKNNA